VIAAVPALIAIFLLGQGVLDRRAWRLDLTPERRYTLSDHAERILDALTRTSACSHSRSRTRIW
jgi:hypothetical protein